MSALPILPFLLWTVAPSGEGGEDSGRGSRERSSVGGQPAAGVVHPVGLGAVLARSRSRARAASPGGRDGPRASQARSPPAAAPASASSSASSQKACCHDGPAAEAAAGALPAGPTAA